MSYLNFKNFEKVSKINMKLKARKARNHSYDELAWKPISKNRSTHRRCSFKKDVLKNFAKFWRTPFFEEHLRELLLFFETGFYVTSSKHLCQSLFFNKVAGLRPATLLKKRLWDRCFLVNFVKFLRTHFSQNTSGRLLLKKEWIRSEDKKSLKW